MPIITDSPKINICLDEDRIIKEVNSSVEDQLISNAAIEVSRYLIHHTNSSPYYIESYCFESDYQGDAIVYDLALRKVSYDGLNWFDFK